jgi:hypothetical protein
MLPVACFLYLLSFFVDFVTDEFFLFLALCLVVFLILIINKWDQLALLRKTKSEAFRRLVAERPDDRERIIFSIQRGQQHDPTQTAQFRDSFGCRRVRNVIFIL